MYRMGGASSAFGFVLVADVDSGRQLRVPAAEAATRAVAFSKSGLLFAAGASGTDRAGLSAYNLANLSKLTVASLPNVNAPSVYDLMFSPDDTKLAVATSTAPAIVLYDTATWGAISGSGAPALTGAAAGVAWSPDGALLAVLTNIAPYLYVYETATMTQVPFTPALPAVSAGTGALRFSPDGTKLAVGTTSAPQLTVFNVGTWTKQTIAATPGTQVADVAWSPDGKYLATVGGVNASSSVANSMSVYDTATWTKKALTGAVAFNTTCVFTPDSKYLAVGSVSSDAAYGNIIFYDTTTWAPAPAVAERLLPSVRGLSDIQFYADPPRYMRGTVRNVSGNPVARKIRAYMRRTGDLVAETTSNATTGNYVLEIYRPESELIDLQFLTMDGELLNDLFYARATTSAT